VERITVQAELEHAMELAKAAAVSKNQFLANMSHEVLLPRVRKAAAMCVRGLTYCLLLSAPYTAQCHHRHDGADAGFSIERLAARVA
jgi:rubrerythrin